MSDERNAAVRQILEADGLVYGKDFTDETIAELSDGNQRPHVENPVENNEETEE